MRHTLASALTLFFFAAPAAAQTAPATGPWLGLTLPSGSGSAPAVRVGARPARPVALPAGEAPSPAFNADTLKADVATIVGFARDARATKEIGSGQMWGRIAGFPSSDKTVEWSADQFRKAGITDVRIQPIAQDAKSALWLPLSWQVKLLADPAFGPGTADLLLESALPIGPSHIPGGTLTAPLVYVGAASPAVLNHIDVKGKIAVQLIVPSPVALNVPPLTVLSAPLLLSRICPAPSHVPDPAMLSVPPLTILSEVPLNVSVTPELIVSAPPIVPLVQLIALPPTLAVPDSVPPPNRKLSEVIVPLSAALPESRFVPAPVKLVPV
ncbi:MAG: hypothetical protein Q8S13_03780, partial [Dehalococcoidia bacterium]|nr:hypothetical protein [Dehalococcoidia bacterium]